MADWGALGAAAPRPLGALGGIVKIEGDHEVPVRGTGEEGNGNSQGCFLGRNACIALHATY